MGHQGWRDASGSALPEAPRRPLQGWSDPYQLLFTDLANMDVRLEVIRFFNGKKLFLA